MRPDEMGLDQSRVAVRSSTPQRHLRAGTHCFRSGPGDQCLAESLPRNRAIPEKKGSCPSSRRGSFQNSCSSHTCRDGGLMSAGTIESMARRATVRQVPDHYSTGEEPHSALDFVKNLITASPSRTAMAQPPRRRRPFLDERLVRVFHQVPGFSSFFALLPHSGEI